MERAEVLVNGADWLEGHHGTPSRHVRRAVVQGRFCLGLHYWLIMLRKGFSGMRIRFHVPTSYTDAQEVRGTLFQA